MSDDIPVAIVRTRADRRRRISLIWAIPLVTVLVAAWLAWDTLSKRGPEITIRFDSASGLQANQSRIRYRDVDLGVVEKVVLSPDRRAADGRSAVLGGEATFFRGFADRVGNAGVRRLHPDGTGLRSGCAHD